MKASKADDWDRKYHKALLKEQEPIWVAAGVSVELVKLLADVDSGKYSLVHGGALELACGVGIDSAAIAQSAFLQDAPPCVASTLARMQWPQQPRGIQLSGLR
jgi:hypothetical protein